MRGSLAFSPQDPFFLKNFYLTPGTEVLQRKHLLLINHEKFILRQCFEICLIFITYKDENRDGEMAHQLRLLTALTEYLVQFPESIPGSS